MRLEELRQVCGDVRVSKEPSTSDSNANGKDKGKRNALTPDELELEQSADRGGDRGAHLTQAGPCAQSTPAAIPSPESPHVRH